MRTRQRVQLYRFFLLIAFVVMVASVAGLGGKSPDRGAANELTADVQKELQGPTKGRIINGTQLTTAGFQQRWPFLVSLRDMRNAPANSLGGHGCGGALVAPTLVLTAAHCADMLVAGSTKVLTGTADFGNAAAPAQLLQVASFVVHPGWNKNPVLGNDLALVRLQAASRAPTISVVGPGEDAIWGQGRGVADTATSGPWLAGWGATQTNQPVRWASEISTPIWSDAACGHPKVGAGVGVAISLLLCTAVADDPATAAIEERGQCRGDSGSPLIALANGIPRVIGTVSFSETDCRKPSPDASTRLAAHRDWLTQNGVPIGTGTVAGQFPAPSVVGGGAAPPEPTGPTVWIDAPNDGAVIAPLNGSTPLRWSAREDMRPGRLTVSLGSATILTQEAGGYIGYTLGNHLLRAGTYTWCISSVARATNAPSGEACRTFLRKGVHLAQMTSASWRGKRATYGGVLTSSATQVKVTVKLYNGRKLVATKRLALKTKPNGAPTRFTFATPISSSLRGARALKAVIAVSGGGTNKTFSNVLR
ncbi:MAG: hypothetical protein JWM90_875 [Thermoleophilia bacterium]|nr:hypothetical protein [Thermoleophilia bacterium]